MKLRSRQSTPWALAKFLLVALLVSSPGCSTLRRSNNAADEGFLRLLSPVDEQSASEIDQLVRRDAGKLDESKVANPPAKTIRFSGNEVVLGLSQATQIAPVEFKRSIEQMVGDEKLLSAKIFVEQHPRAAKRYLWTQLLAEGSGEVNSTAVHFVATVSSVGLPSNSSWGRLLKIVEAEPSTWAKYARSYGRILDGLKSSDEVESEDLQNRDVESDLQKHVEMLSSSAEALNHPIVATETQRLLAGRESIAGRHAWAESLCLQAVEVSVESKDLHRAADILLEVCKAIELQVDTPGYRKRHREAWTTAVEFQVRAFDRTGVIDEQFWELANEARIDAYPWPENVGEAFQEACESIGCTADSDLRSETALWAAVGKEHYDASRFQQALLCFKKAERLASEVNKGWLRIAQGKCLASLGQEGAAAAILSGPATSASVELSCAAKAALGSAKLAAGAYQQGAQLLNRALNDASGVDFAGKLQAQADLAVAIAILGETEEAIDAFRRIQYAFARRGDHVGLIQAYQNEKRILELEGNAAAADSAERKIVDLEREWR